LKLIIFCTNLILGIIIENKLIKKDLIWMTIKAKFGMISL